VIASPFGGLVVTAVGGSRARPADWFVSDRKAQCLIESKGAPFTAPLARG
jgi:hypothetical protein